MHEDPKVFLRVNPHSKQPWLEIKSVWISALAALDSHNVGILAGWHSGQEKTRGKLSDQTVWKIKNKHAETSQMPLGKKNSSNKAMGWWSRRLPPAAQWKRIRLTECRLTKLLLQGLTQLGNLSKLGIPGSPARIRVLFNFISVKKVHCLHRKKMEKE